MLVVAAEKAVSQELKMRVFLTIRQIRFDDGVFTDAQRIGIQLFRKIPSVRIVGGIGIQEQLIVQADLCRYRVVRGNPVDRSFYLPIGQPAASRGRIVSACLLYTSPSPRDS